MAKTKITGRQLRSLGYTDGPALSLTLQIAARQLKHSSEAEALSLLKRLSDTPQDFLDDAIWSPVAFKLMPPEEEVIETPALRSTSLAFEIWGRNFIGEEAIHQMYQATRLPVAVGGALMPDAHSGFGLPIGGVLATENVVIPYAVGVDIGCRMSLSIFDIDPAELQRRRGRWAAILDDATLFGSGAQFDRPADHYIMDDPRFEATELLRSIHGKAWKQLGSSGSGNHFAEWGIVCIGEKDDSINLPPGQYVGLLSHSGSRALGARVAEHYTRIAMDKCRLPSQVRHLAWLSLQDEDGIAYWDAMNLAGDYARACHEVIHTQIAKAIGRNAVVNINNHHNFAWKEKWQEREVIMHRKGATPAGKGVLGIIPGSMATEGFIVKGKGNEAALYSASHGAGRKMSRGRAAAAFNIKNLRENLDKANVQLIGGAPDEAPMAYKNIHEVMAAQTDLVEVIGSFMPSIVKMDG
jgi:tRNA-splicing ligase RtcB